MDNSSRLLLFTVPNGAVKVDVFFKDESVWLTQKALAELFGVQRPATQCRIWATKTLREFITKGLVPDDKRLLQGAKVFGKDYFDELLERLREIRTSTRRCGA